MNTIKSRVYPAWWTYAAIAAAAVLLAALLNGYTFGADIRSWGGFLYLISIALVATSMFLLKRFTEHHDQKSLSWTVVTFVVGMMFMSFLSLMQSVFYHKLKGIIMKMFTETVGRALENLHKAKKFSKTKRHQLMQVIGEEGFGVMWFTVAALGILLVALSLKINNATLQSAYAQSVVVVAYIVLAIFTPVVLFHWSYKSRNVCLTHDIIDCSAEFIVGVVQNCQRAGASLDQLEVLQTLAKDSTVPENWWNWLNQATVNHIREQDKLRRIQLQQESKTTAQHKIDTGRILN